MSLTGDQWRPDPVAGYQPPQGYSRHTHEGEEVAGVSDAVTTAISTAVSQAMPVGVITAYWGTVAPANWLLCDGTSFSSVTYPALAAHLGGTTLPNLKGKVIVSLDAAQTEFDTLGETGGAKTVTLTTAQLASHNHTQNSHNHTQNGHSHTHDHTGVTGNGAPANHSHAMDFEDNTRMYYDAGAPSNTFFAPSGATRWINTRSFNGNFAGHKHALGGVDTSQTHAHGLVENSTPATAVNIGFTATNNAEGGGQAHNNLQPYMTLNYIIKAA